MSRRTGWLLWLCTLIVFSLIMGGAAYLGYGYLQQHQQHLDTLAADIRGQHSQQQATQTVLQTQHTELAAQQQAFADLRETYSAQSTALQQAQQQVQDRETALNQQLRQAQQMVANSDTHWKVAEAEYLLRLAQQHRQLTRDLKTIRYLLQQADQRLRSTQNPDWQPVRAQIAREIASLNNIDIPDHVGISAQLQAMNAQVTALRLLQSRPLAADESQDTESTATTDAKPSLLDDLWGGFQSMVRIRKHDQPIQAMIPPAQQNYLYEHIRQQIQLTGLAVLRLDNRLYQASLQQIIARLNEYFDPNETTTRSMLASLTSLLEIDLTPKFPDIQQSLRTLLQQQQLANITNPSTAP